MTPETAACEVRPSIVAANRDESIDRPTAGALHPEAVSGERADPQPEVSAAGELRPQIVESEET